MRKTRFFFEACLLLFCFAFVGIPLLSQPKIENNSGEQEYSLSDFLIKYSREKIVNIIVSTSGGVYKFSTSLTDGSTPQVMKKIADQARVQLIEDHGVFVFTRKDPYVEFSKFPFLPETPNPQEISMEFSRVEIRDLLKLFKTRTTYNIVVDKSARGSLSLRLSDVPWPIALHHTTAALGYECRLSGNTIIVADKRKMGELVPPASQTTDKKSAVSLCFRDTDIRDLINLVAIQFSRDFITGYSVRGNVTVDLQDVDENNAMHIIANLNGFDCKLFNDVWVLNDGRAFAKTLQSLSLPLSATKEDALSISFRDTEVRNILALVALKSGLKIGVSKEVKGNLTLRLTNKSPIDTLRYIAGSQGWNMHSEGNNVTISSNPEKSEEISFELLAKEPMGTKENLSPSTISNSNAPHLPLRIMVRGIVGNDKSRRAIVVYANEFQIFERGQTVNNKFKVLDILPDGVKILGLPDNKEQVFQIK